jgi:hypothetical protein
MNVKKDVVIQKTMCDIINSVVIQACEGMDANPSDNNECKYSNI